jgi:uncharacterized secreted protein with C-terminal beta-propeller domain
MQIGWRASLVVGLAGSTLALSACTGIGAGQPPLGQVAAAFQLVRYDSCDDALEQLKQAAAEYVTPYGLGEVLAYAEGLVPQAAADAGARSATGAAEAASGEAAPPAYSTTNIHEAGVDEPDLVKTDGRRIVSVVDGTLRVVDVEKQAAGTLRLSGPADEWYADRLLLAGDRALIMGYGSIDIRRDSPSSAGATELSYVEGSRLVLVDLSGEPRIVSELDLSGSYVDARQVDSVARIVVRSGVRLGWTYPAEPGLEDSALAANRELLARSTIEDWLPRYALSEGSDRSEGSLVDCADVSHPQVYSGTSMLTVLTLDLTAALRPNNSVAVVADGQTVYGTGSSLYIADDHTGFPMPVDMRAGVFRDMDPATEIHKFDITGTGKPQYVASGSVDGRLLNQYSLSEHQGYLRVATTLDQWSGVTDPVPQSESRVTVLSQRGDGLQVVGSVGGLGKGEQIYAVRFIGPVGYVVTFRQVDPLYTLDLGDPTSPRVVGELKIPGYSAYLHPAGEDRLIGVGQDADDQGMARGSQVSLFDVGDPAAPARLDNFPMPGGWSEVEHDPHAFLYWPDEQLVVIPVWWDGGMWPEAAPNDAKQYIAPAGGAVVLRIVDDSLVEVGTLSHGGSGTDFDYSADPTIRRSLVIGDTMWTLSASGALASDLEDLEEQAWVPFTG